MKKICIITCYNDPNYVRARVLRTALNDNPYQVFIVKNKHKGLLRYPEVIWKLFTTRLRHNPDIYLLTFRGYEILPFLNVIAAGKKRVFDEFINPIEWSVYEHKKFAESSLIAKILWHSYRALLKNVTLILADTQIHAEYSAKLMKLPLDKFRAIPVGADEEVFKPQKREAKEGFQVFYYGNMLPLHGLRYVIEAALILRHTPSIKFLLSGGGEAAAALVNSAVERGANITHKDWTKFDELPKVATESSLTLVGPFGNTLQSKMVITGKTYQFLATGVPILVGESDEKSPLKDKENCLLVPQGNSEALAAKIDWAYKNKDELHGIGQAGRRVYDNNYSRVVISKILKQIIDSL